MCVCASLSAAADPSDDEGASAPSGASESISDSLLDAEERKRRDQIRQTVHKELQECRERLRVSFGGVTEVGESRKKFVSYAVITEDTALPKTWMVQRRYSDFAWLHKVLSLDPVLQCILLPQLPPKQVLGRFEDDFVQRRRRGLLWFLERLVEIKAVAQHKEFRGFLTASDREWRESQADRERLLSSFGPNSSNGSGSGSSSPSGGGSGTMDSVGAAQPRKVSKFGFFKQKLRNVTTSLTGQKKPQETTPLDDELTRVSAYARQFHAIGQQVDGALRAVIEDMDRESDLWCQLLQHLDRRPGMTGGGGGPGAATPAAPAVATTSNRQTAAFSRSQGSGASALRRSASNSSTLTAQRSSYTSFTQILAAGGDDTVFRAPSLTAESESSSDAPATAAAAAAAAAAATPTPSSSAAASHSPGDGSPSELSVNNSNSRAIQAFWRDSWLTEEEYPLELYVQSMSLIMPELLADEANLIQRATREEFSHYSHLAAALQTRVIQPRAELMVHLQAARRSMDTARDKLQQFQFTHGHQLSPKAAAGSIAAQENLTKEHQKLLERQTQTEERFRALQTRLHLINDRCVRQVLLMHRHKHERLREAVAQLGRAGLATERRLQLQLASLRQQIEKIVDPCTLDDPVEPSTQFGSTVAPLRTVRSGRLQSDEFEPAAGRGVRRASSHLYSHASVLSEDENDDGSVGSDSDDVSEPTEDDEPQYSSDRGSSSTDSDAGIQDLPQQQEEEMDSRARPLPAVPSRQ